MVGSETEPEEAESPAEGDTQRRPFSTARARILGWFVLLLVLATVASLLLQRRILHDRLDSRIDSQLTVAAENFREVSRTSPGGVDATPQEETAAIFDAFLRQNAPAEGIAYFSFVDGEAYKASFGAPASLDRDQRILDAVAATRTSTRAEIDTAAGPARYLAVPVETEGAVQGVLVIAAFPREAREEVEAAVRVAAAVSLSVLFGVSVLGWVVAGRVLAPVRLVTQTAQRITETDLSRRIVAEGDDEVARLASTFNSMLTRLEAAFRSQREFLSDAGHELRTPITVIRGQLEVLGDDPDERRETIALVTDELDRMSRIVDDLSLLASFERPGFLRTEAVALPAFMPEVLAKAEVLAHRSWALEATADTTISADRQLLTQAVMNLATNATKYTTTGAVIALGSSVDDGHARIWVRDEGSGIPSEEQARIFERFARGQGQRRDTGSGLGLAIVRSIAVAHGGQVEVDSEPGRGSTFTLVLPTDGPKGAHG